MHGQELNGGFLMLERLVPAGILPVEVDGAGGFDTDVAQDGHRVQLVLNSDVGSAFVVQRFCMWENSPDRNRVRGVKDQMA